MKSPNCGTKTLANSMIKILLAALIFCSCATGKKIDLNTSENWILNGEESVKYSDDYGSHYTITATTWIQDSQNTFHIMVWNFDENYLLAKNDSSNIDEKGKYTRIDFMKFENMEPYTWGYCLTEYSAESIDELLVIASADRENPKTGCNGFPFSRMKKN